MFGRRPPPRRARGGPIRGPRTPSVTRRRGMWRGRGQWPCPRGRRSDPVCAMRPCLHPFPHAPHSFVLFTIPCMPLTPLSFSPFPACPSLPCPFHHSLHALTPLSFSPFPACPFSHVPSLPPMPAPSTIYPLFLPLLGCPCNPSCSSCRARLQESCCLWSLLLVLLAVTSTLLILDVVWAPRCASGGSTWGASPTPSASDTM